MKAADQFFNRILSFCVNTRMTQSEADLDEPALSRAPGELRAPSGRWEERSTGLGTEHRSVSLSCLFFELVSA